MRRQAATEIVSAPDSCKVYTDQALADTIVRRIGDDDTARWLEPSAGPGAFLGAIAALGVLRARVTAFEIEQGVCQNLNLAHVLEGQDFIRWSLQTTELYDRIVGNPPFVALSRLDAQLYAAAIEVKTPRNRTVRRKANYWYVFVCAMLQVLHEGGSLGIILPASWDYADYCADLRDFLPSQFREFETHRCERPLFNGVGEGAVVIIAKGYQETPVRDDRYEYPDFESLVAGLAADVVPNNRLVAGQTIAPRAENLCLFGDVAEVRIGAVTGDAKYFLFTEEQRLQSEMPEDCFLPALTRARHVLAAESTWAHWNDLRDGNERVWLFRPSENSLSNSVVDDYLNLLHVKGGCDRKAFKVRNRKPWYEVPVPEHIDGFISGMSGAGPFICMNAMVNLTASNTLYVVNFRNDICVEMKYGWALAMLSSPAHVSILRLLRRYADGLAKHEPKDLLQIEMPRPREGTDHRDSYIQAVCLRLRGDHAGARRLADENMV